MTLVRLALAVLLAAAALPAQFYRDGNYRDLELMRNRPRPYESLLQVRGAATYTLPDDEDEDLGLSSEFSGQGSVYYHTESFGDRKSRIDAYAGTDGAFLGVRETFQPGSSAVLELSSRYFPYYREGFYRGDDWIPTGQYDGFDWGGYLGLATFTEDGYAFEVGPFYRRQGFDRNDETLLSYAIPEDYDTYGLRGHLEQSTLTFDRNHDRPTEGFLVGVRLEYEFNNSDERFGTALWQSSLPDAMLRGWGHLEWYFPTGGGSWEFLLDAGMADRDDRVYVHDAQKPIGHYWADTRLGYRFDLGSFAIKPFGHLQYTSTSAENGIGADDDFWIGGGAQARWDVSRWLGFWAEYSYLNNPNRPTVSFHEDVWGEHQFFAGLELTFGGV